MGIYNLFVRMNSEFSQARIIVLDLMCKLVQNLRNKNLKEKLKLFQSFYICPSRSYLIAELKCIYGNRTLNHNEKWSGKLCGAVVTCKNGVATVTKCPGIPPRPRDCVKPKLVVQRRSGKCCRMNWKCTGIMHFVYSKN